MSWGTRFCSWFGMTTLACIVWHDVWAPVHRPTLWMSLRRGWFGCPGFPSASAASYRFLSYVQTCQDVCDGVKYDNCLVLPLAMSLNLSLGILQDNVTFIQDVLTTSNLGSDCHESPNASSNGNTNNIQHMPFDFTFNGISISRLGAAWR